METKNETKAKFIQKVMEHLNPDIKTDEDFTKYATSQWMKLLASKSNLCSSDLDKMEELIKSVIQSSIDWKDKQIDTIMLTTEGCLRSFFESQGNTKESIDNFIDAIKTQINKNLNKQSKDEQIMYDFYLEELKECNKFYREFTKYLYEDCAGSKDLILEAVTNNTCNKYVGYVVTENSIDNNGDLILTFKVDDITYKAHWQQSDNYACCQWTGYAEDDYKGYLLFPTHGFKKFFCIYYEC